jgi:hypothetical protein
MQSRLATRIAPQAWHSKLMIESISERQHSLLVAWLGSFSVVGDYSWPLQDTTVLHVESTDGRKFIVKANQTSHHIPREIAAHARGMDGLEVLPQSMVSCLTKEVSAVELYPVALVTSHGDYQPRNWLCDAGEVKVIDFGRADLRPWVRDLVRLSHQQFLTAPNLAEAFHEGFRRTMSSPEEHAVWRLENLNQAVGTVVWAHGIGDHGFARQGVEMVGRVLAES